jgi:hypothetical protein
VKGEADDSDANDDDEGKGDDRGHGDGLRSSRVIWMSG